MFPVEALKEISAAADKANDKIKELVSCHGYCFVCQAVTFTVNFRKL